MLDAPAIPYGRARALWRALEEHREAREALAPFLCTLAQGRFAGRDHRALLRDQARARVGAVCDAALSPVHDPPDEGCPPTMVPQIGVSGSISSTWVELWPWSWRDQGRLQVAKGSAPPRSDPFAFPEVRVAAPGSFDPALRQNSDVLPRDANALLRLRHGWIAGISHGEFGGGLWWVPSDGAPRLLLAGNFATLLDWHDHHLAVDALGHMGAGIGALVEVVERGRDVDVELFAELPTDPWSVEDWGETLVATSDRGLLEIHADGQVQVHRCEGGDPEYVHGPPFARFADIPPDARPRGHDVRACFALTPSCTVRETPDSNSHTFELLFTARDETGWTGRVNLEAGSLIPPRVAECLLRASHGWKLPPTTVSAFVAVFHYACTPP